jgi:hypothetical protein
LAEGIVWAKGAFTGAINDKPEVLRWLTAEQFSWMRLVVSYESKVVTRVTQERRIKRIGARKILPLMFES